MSAAAATDQARPGWDKRAWRTASILCALIDGLLFCDSFGPLERRLPIELRQGFAAVGVLLALFVVPPILSGIARRRTLLWAYLPVAALFICAGVAVGLDAVPGWDDPDAVSDSTWQDGVYVLLVFLIGPLLSAGPVCLFRVMRRRAKRQMLARQSAIDMAMRTPREGSWPPPPATKDGEV